MGQRYSFFIINKVFMQKKDFFNNYLYFCRKVFIF